MLSQHQVLYISQGRGEFEAEGAGSCELKAGDAFLLFPGVWHRYRPLPETGWTEYWVGFAGDYAARLTGSLFSPVRPVVHVGHMDSLLRLFVHMSEIMQTTPPGYRLLAAAEAMSILMQKYTNSPCFRRNGESWKVRKNAGGPAFAYFIRSICRARLMDWLRVR